MPPRPRPRFASCNYPMSPGASRARPSQSAGPDQPAHFARIPSFPLEPARKCKAPDAAPASAQAVRAGREFLTHRRASGIAIVKRIDINKYHPAVGQPCNHPLSSNLVPSQFVGPLQSKVATHILKIHFKAPPDSVTRRGTENAFAITEILQNSFRVCKFRRIRTHVP